MVRFISTLEEEEAMLPLLVSDELSEASIFPIFAALKVGFWLVYECWQSKTGTGTDITQHVVKLHQSRCCVCLGAFQNKTQGQSSLKDNAKPS